MFRTRPVQVRAVGHFQDVLWALVRPLAMGSLVGPGINFWKREPEISLFLNESICLILSMAMLSAIPTCKLSALQVDSA